MPSDAGAGALGTGRKQLRGNADARPELTLEPSPPAPAPCVRPTMGSGLQLYKFGEAVSIVFFSENWRPDSYAAADQRLLRLCLLNRSHHLNPSPLRSPPPPPPPPPPPFGSQFL